MCGIAGIVGGRKDAGAPVDALRTMSRALAHRGPDDVGEWIDASGNIAFAHRRLSILDPSPAGHQPMSTPSGRLHIVYNGEIYNFRELRSTLEHEGRRFTTESDTEVLLAAWERWGAACLQMLRGMFAFALWDCDRRELVLVRDRLGIKPLYYAELNDGCLFASEIRALLASGLVPRTLDRQAIWDYLSHGSVVEPRTILRHARAVPAGHLLRLREDTLAIERYWDVADATSSARVLPPPTYADAMQQVRAQLEQATRYHLVSDVPVGAFLSGGIDSTVVVGLASQVSGQPIRTFSVGYGGEHGALDELRWARLVADRFGSDHTEVVLTADMVGDLLDRAAAALDQPSVDGTNTFVVSEAARRDVTVALSGLGGDELFAGYPHFARYARIARIAPAGAGMLRSRASERLLAVLPGRVRHAINELADTPAERLAGFRLLADESMRRTALTSGFLDQFEPVAPAQRMAQLLRPDLDTVAQVSYVELNGYLRNTLLRDSDAMSMAHGLEIRPVLLDHELVELAFGLPAMYKSVPGRPKRIFVDAVADLLPPEIGARRKMGFELPYGSWLQGPLRERALDLLQSSPAEQLFSSSFVAVLAAELHGGKARAHRLWSVIMLLAFLDVHQLSIER